MIAVVIPYFQREPGILAKALLSVFASEGVEDVCVIVVDDASPISAMSELAEMGTTRFPVKIIQQPNGGPGAARNTGLDNLPDAVDYVAFLDSDDTWSPQHLRNALVALSVGFDVYFCDLIQLGADVSGFQRAGRIDPSKHNKIAGRNDLHAYQGDMFNQIITGNIIGTSTVMFDRRNLMVSDFVLTSPQRGRIICSGLSFHVEKLVLPLVQLPRCSMEKGSMSTQGQVGVLKGMRVGLSTNFAIARLCYHFTS